MLQPNHPQCRRCGTYLHQSRLPYRWLGPGEPELVPPVEVIYALRRVADGAVKVGCSCNPYERIRGLSRQHGLLDWLGWQYVDDAPSVSGYDIEAALHVRFHQGRSDRTEWYAEPLPPPLVAWLPALEKLPSDYPHLFAHGRVVERTLRRY